MTAYITEFGDVSPRTAGQISKKLLKPGIPMLILEQLAQSIELDKNTGVSIIARRYEGLDSSGYAAYAMTEGVTGNTLEMTKTDITIPLTQLGSGITITDVIEDNHEDPVLQQAYDRLGEQAAIVVERLRWGQLVAGTSVKYKGAGVARNTVNAKVDADFIANMIKTMKKANCVPITRRTASTTAFGTVSVNPCYVCVTHPDVEPDIRAIQGFKENEDYGGGDFEGEIGSWRNVKFIVSNICPVFPDAGATGGTNVISTTGTNADVYPLMFFSKDGFAISAFKGEYAIKPMVLNAGKPSKSDPWGQRGYITWKTRQGAKILNDQFIWRGEVAATKIQ